MTENGDITFNSSLITERILLKGIKIQISNFQFENSLLYHKIS